MKAKIVVKALEPKLFVTQWKDIEALFGKKGACGGCWCMFWRQGKGDKWGSAYSSRNKAAFKDLVKKGKAPGALAYLNHECVGWASFDKKENFSKLARSPSLNPEDGTPKTTWAIPCFYIHPKYRGKGVATALLRFVSSYLKESVNTRAVLEGYPLLATEKAKKIPAAFAWTGTTSLFQKSGFKLAGPNKPGKQIYAKPIK